MAHFSLTPFFQHLSRKRAAACGPMIVSFPRWYDFCCYPTTSYFFQKQEIAMLKFLSSVAGVIFLIGLIVVILLLMLIF